MGKNSKGDDPWDDSALLHAFHRALSSYKAMHGTNNVARTSNTEGLTDAEGISTSTEITEDSEVHNVSDTPEEFYVSHDDGVAHGELPHAEENIPYASHPEQVVSGETIYDNAGGYDPTEYYQLLHQYYVLEEQRVKLLQQLCLTSYWHYQMPFQSSTCQASQDGYSNGLGCGSSASIQIGNQYIPSSYPGYYGSCVPWNSAWGAPHPALKGGLEASGDGLRESSMAAGSTEAALKTAVAEAERLVSSLKLEASSRTISYEKDGGVGRKGTHGLHASSPSQNDSSETDLAQVLGAWYTAGFYTGRYTLEQSLKRGHE